jgi:tetratricopeptide (TPR) repeat protein
MKNVQERIEGSYRLMAFKRMKMRLFALEIVVLFAIAILLMIMKGGKFQPAYLPMDYFALIMIIMLILLVAEAQYFRLLEIAYSKSKSGKYLMARNTIRSAIAIIFLCVIFVSLFALPWTVSAIEEGYDIGVSTNNAPGQDYNYTLTTRDMLGTRNVGAITVNITEGQDNVYIIRKDNYEAEAWSHRINYRINWAEGAVLYQPMEDYSENFEEFVIYVQNNGTTMSSFYIKVTYTISPIFSTYAPILGIVFIIIEGFTISYFLPIREKYSTSSIFSRSYVETRDVGTETMSERVLALDKTLSEEEISKEVEAVEPQPLPIAAPEPEAKPGQARKKGVFEVGPSIQKDVACASCGAMNSPDTPMCFSCGAVLVAQPKEVIKPEDLMHRGRAFLKDGRNQDAIWCFDEVLKGDHRHEQALFLKAKALLGEKRYELSVQYLNTVIQQNPAHQKAFALRGEIFEEMEMYDRALDSYEKALTFGPDEEVSARIRELKEGDKEEVLNQFMMLPGIGPAKANALYDGGFASIDSLRSASLEQLCQIKGISERIARRLLKEFGRE